MARIPTSRVGRRTLLASATAALILPPRLAIAQSLVATPGQTEGPFYPAAWDGDVDGDLVVVTGAAARAQGQVLHLAGRVRDLQGAPLADAMIEIWQCDAGGVYRHPRDVGRRPRDQGFQGFGRVRTDALGGYAFRTLRPVAYPGRTPHIHFRVVAAGRRALTTQMYLAGEPQNARDGVLASIRDTRQRESVIVALAPADSREPGAVQGQFDLVIA